MVLSVPSYLLLCDAVWFVQTLGFLAQDGILRFINIHSCKQLFQVSSHDQVRAS